MDWILGRCGNVYKFEKYRKAVPDWTSVNLQWDWHKIFKKEWEELNKILVSVGAKDEVIETRYKALWDNFKQKAVGHNSHAHFIYESPVELRTIYPNDKRGCTVNPMLHKS